MRVTYLQYAIDSDGQALEPGEVVRYVCADAHTFEALMETTIGNDTVGIIAANVDFNSESPGVVVTVRAQASSVYVDVYNASAVQVTLSAGVLRAAVIRIPHKETNDGTSDNGTISGPFVTLP